MAIDFSKYQVGTNTTTAPKQQTAGTIDFSKYTVKDYTPSGKEITGSLVDSSQVDKKKSGFINKAQDFFQGVGFRQQQGTDLISKVFGKNEQIISNEKSDLVQKINEKKEAGKDTKQLEKRLARVLKIEDPTTPIFEKTQALNELRLDRYVRTVGEGAGNVIAGIYDYVTKSAEEKYSDEEYVKKVEKKAEKSRIWQKELEQIKKFQAGENIVSKNVSKAIKKWADETAPSEQYYSEKLTSSAGSMGIFMLMSLGSAGNPYIPVIIESIGEAGNVYSTLREEGAGVEEAGNKSDVTLGANLVLNTMLNIFGFIDEEKSIKLIVKSFGEEGVQEGSQQVISNLATNRPWDEGVLESAIIGGLTAGITSVVYPSALPVTQNTTELNPQVIKDKVLSDEKLSKSKDGQQLLKKALEAESRGEKLVVSVTEDGKIMVGTQEVSLETQQTTETKQSTQIASSGLELANNGVYAELTQEQLDFLKDEVKNIDFTKDDRPHLSPIEKLQESELEKVTLEELRKLSPNIDKALAKLEQLDRQKTKEVKIEQGEVSEPKIKEAVVDDTLLKELPGATLKMINVGELKSSLSMNEDSYEKYRPIINEYKTKITNGEKITPVVLNKDGKIIDGNTKLMAMNELGIKNIPTITVSDKQQEVVFKHHWEKGFANKDNLPKQIKKKSTSKIPKTKLERIKKIEDYVNKKGTKFRIDPNSEVAIFDNDKITSKFLENRDVKGKKEAGWQYLYELSKSNSLGLKQVEREIIQGVLNKNFQGQKIVNMADFRRAVIGQLMPLEIIQTSTYASYGSENLNINSDENKTYILNSPFEHGLSGHFTGDFVLTLDPNDVMIKEIPVQEQNPTAKWAVIKKGVKLTEENIAENVFTVAITKDEAMKWVEDHIESGGFGNAKLKIPRKKGLFSHFRSFDVDKIAHIAEVQSDVFQHFGAISDAGEKGAKKAELDTAEIDLKRLELGIKDSNNLIKALQDKDAVKTMNRFYKLFSFSDQVRVLREVTNKWDVSSSFLQEMLELFEKTVEREGRADLSVIDEYGATKRLENIISLFEKKRQALKKEIKKLQKEYDSLEISKEEKQFLTYKNIWHERTVRELITTKAREGFDVIRFPTPRTIAVIEAFASGSGGEFMPYEITNADNHNQLEVGDTINYGGVEMTVVEADQYSIKVAESDKVVEFMHSDAVQEEIDNLVGDARYEFEGRLKEYFGDINTPKKAQEVIDAIRFLNQHLDFINKDKKIEEIKKEDWKSDEVKAEEIKNLKTLKDISTKELKKIPSKLLNDNKDSLYHFYLENGTERVLDLMVGSDKNSFSFDDFEEQLFEELADGYNMDYEGIYGGDNVFMEEEGYDTRIRVVEDDSPIEMFRQPDEYEDTPFAEDFDINDYEGEQRTVLDFYDKQLLKYIKKLRKGNLELVKDKNGYEWWETRVTEEDKAPPTAYRIKEDLESVGIKITQEQEQEIINLNKNIFGDENVKIVSQILANNKALGAYSKQIIKLLDKQSNITDTFLHEAVHKYLDVFTTKEEYVNILVEAQEKYGIDDLYEVEERVAEDFIKYTQKKKITGRKTIFNKIIDRIKKFFKNQSAINKLYEDIISGRAKQNENVKASKVAVSIEQNLNQRFENLAGFETRNVKSQAKLVSKLIAKDINLAKDIVTGAKPLPAGMSGSMFIAGMENYATENNDIDLLRSLATSPLVSETSVHAQELRFLAERDKTSVLSKIQELANERAKIFKKTHTEGLEKAIEKETKKIKDSVKISKWDWDSFIKSIEC